MKVLFCHDGPLKRDEFGNYYGTAHNDETFSRYYAIANEIIVVIRVNEIDRAEAESKLSKITVQPFKVISCPIPATLKGILWEKRETLKIIKEEIKKSDYVVSRLPSFIGLIAIDYARKFKKPYIVEVVACPWDALWNHSIKGKLVAPVLYFATRKRVKAAAYSVYVTNEFLQHRYPSMGESINCSNVALTEFDDVTLEKRLEKIFNMRNDSVLIIGTTAAVNVKYKGQQFIIEALGKLKKQGITKFEYQLVGGGNHSYLKSIAKQHEVSDQIKFLGAMKHNKVFEWLDSIDLYVQPSRQEGLPRALIEAMSRGLPAFGARTGGIPELLEKENIFSNTRSNIDEICVILNSFNVTKMKEQAQRNYAESKKYDKTIIEERRKAFFSEFKDAYISK